MAVGRQLNIKGQWRVDVPHLRMIESGVANDFDALAGVMLAGKQPYIVNGFTITNAAINLPATDLVLNVAGSTAIHYYASENGSILLVPASRAAETLNVTNPRVVGAFASNSTNYIGVDFRRSEDSVTSDVVQFLDPSTEAEAPKTVPLARTLDYRIIIQTIPFSGTPNVCPVAIVVTNSQNQVADNGSGLPNVRDARSMYFRLAAGGDSPLPENPYSWPNGRAPESIYNFAGGDKAITHERDWKRAVMTRLWEVTGGQYWYSDTTMQNLRVCYGPAIAPLNDNVEFDSGTGTIKWIDISILFATNTGDVTTPIYNTVTNNTTGIVLADGYGLYVDVDRFNNGAALTAYSAPLYNLGSPTRPGSRTVIAYRRGNNVYLRDRQYEVGRALPTALTTVLGGVYTNTAAVDLTHPYAVVSDGLGGNAVAAGLTRGSLAAGNLTIGAGDNDTSITLGKSGAFIYPISKFARIYCEVDSLFSSLSVVQKGNGQGLWAQSIGSGPAIVAEAGTGYAARFIGNGNRGTINLSVGSPPSTVSDGDIWFRYDAHYVGVTNTAQRVDSWVYGVLTANKDITNVSTDVTEFDIAIPNFTVGVGAVIEWEMVILGSTGSAGSSLSLVSAIGAGVLGNSIPARAQWQDNASSPVTAYVDLGAGTITNLSITPRLIHIQCGHLIANNTSNVTVSVKFQTSAGTYTMLPGSYIRYRVIYMGA